MGPMMPRNRWGSSRCLSVILGNFSNLSYPFLGYTELCRSHCIGNSQRGMEDHQNLRVEDLPVAAGPCLLCPDVLCHRHSRSRPVRRTRFNHSRGLLQHHGGWSRPEDLRRPLGGGQKHHCGLVHYDPGLRDHCRIDLSTLPDLTPQVLMEKGENHGIRF